MMNRVHGPNSPTSTPAHSLALTKIGSADLFAGKREVIIVHQGEEYRLRITRQEKLILTK